MLESCASVRGVVSIGALLLLGHCSPDEPSWSNNSPRSPVAAAVSTSRQLRVQRQGALDALVREPLRARRAPRLARALAAEASDVPERFRPLSTSIEAERVAQGIPGLAIAIVEGGELSFARGFGSKDPDGLDGVQPSTLFRLASNTKPFTALSVLQQVDRGELAIDDTLLEHLPGFGLDATPEGVPAVTLRQLLSHTSGLADHLDVDAPDEQKTDAALRDFLLGPFRELGHLQSPPGALFSYSNVGFSLLGLVAEMSAGVAFRTLVRERIWGPLGMARTFFEPSEVLADGDYALGVCTPSAPDCAGEGLGSVFAPDSYDAPSSAPAAGAWSSVLDLAKWARFLVHGDPRVLSDALRAEMATPRVSTRFAGDLLSYGLGLEHQSMLVAQPDPAGDVQFYAAPEIYHTGVLPGFRSIVLCVPSIDFCFIALANYDDVNFYDMELAALRLATLPEPVAPPDVAPVPGRFLEYVGSYQDPFALGLLTVSSDERGALQLDWPLLDELDVPYGRALTPTYIDNFNVEVAGDLWPVTFLTGPGGGFDYLRTLDRSVATRWELADIASVSGALGAPAAPVGLRDALERRDF